MKRILIIEDDTALAKGITIALQTAEYTIDSVTMIATARKQLSEHHYDLLLLDINLPDGSGLDFCKSIREGSQVPIILLTARDLEIDVVTGFGVGADDYITKPFSLAILRARIGALLKRYELMKNQSYEFGIHQFNFSQQTFLVNGQQVELSKQEQKLLEKLLANPNHTLTRGALLQHIWGLESDFIEENALSVLVKRVREKLTGANDRLQIKTIYGIGYRLEVLS